MSVPASVVQQLCRYEITAKDLAERYPDVIMSEIEAYSITLEDLYLALDRYLDDPDEDDFRHEWYIPLDSLLGNDIVKHDQIVAPEGWNDYGLPDQYNTFRFVWNRLYDFSNYDLTVNIADLYDEIRIYFENRDKVPDERELTLAQQYYFLYYWDNKYSEATPMIVNMYKNILETRCAEDEENAWILKAYACYGNGNGYYEQDWQTSFDYLMKWFNKTGSPQAANTLGYMYYYGRTNNGIPQYEEAFRYFSIGEAGWFYESKYKLSDMFLHGYGVPQNYEIASNLIWELYPYMIKKIKKGEYDSCLADVAFRAGNLRRDGIDGVPSPEDAYYYYLQAQYAIKMRMKHTDSYGDLSVSKSIQKAIDDVFPLTGIRHTKTTRHTNMDLLLTNHLKRKHKIQMKIKHLAKGNLQLTFTILPYENEQTERKLFVTVPGSGFCGLLKELKVTVRNVTGFETLDDEDTIIFDEVDGPYFLNYGHPVALIEGEYTFKITDAMLSEIYEEDVNDFRGSKNLNQKMYS